MTKGYTAPRSLINKYNLGDSIKELYYRGMNYQEIINTINEKHGIHLNKMNLSRFLSSITPEDIQSNVISNIKGIRDRTSENNIKLLSDYDLMLNDIINSIELSKLSFGEKATLKKSVLIKGKQFRKNLIDTRGEIVFIFQAIDNSNNEVKQFLINVSLELCSDCRKKVVSSIQEMEREETINYNA